MKSDSNLKDLVAGCVKNAFDLTNEISDANYRLETFKIVLSKLLEGRLSDGTGRKEVLPVSAQATAVKDDNANSESEDPPTIVPAGSTRDNIVLLLETKWGDTQRSSIEINKALDYNGVGDSKNVSTRLKQLFEDRIILRRNKDGSMLYWKNPNPPHTNK